MKLSELKPGNRAKIVRLKSSDFLKRRLMDMGLVPGEVVYVEKVAPLGDPIEIVVKNYHLSLRKNEAEIIEIEEVK
ncbi:MAG: ferrous iron transport protein A [Thermodesulfobacterium sp.]|nr:ferrous iron transport protein A [Thermodesulfobacterium sp.]